MKKNQTLKILFSMFLISTIGLLYWVFKLEIELERINNNVEVICEKINYPIEKHRTKKKQ